MDADVGLVQPVVDTRRIKLSKRKSMEEDQNEKDLLDDLNEEVKELTKRIDLIELSVVKKKVGIKDNNSLIERKRRELQSLLDANVSIHY